MLLSEKELAQKACHSQAATNWRGLRTSLIKEVVPTLKEQGFGFRMKLLTRNRPAYHFHWAFILLQYQIRYTRFGWAKADEWLERNYRQFGKTAHDIWNKVYSLANEIVEKN